MTIAKLYENHKNGKVSKQSFLNEARKDANLPWVNNLTSYEDAVKILKNKSIIKESASPFTKSEEVTSLTESHVLTTTQIIDRLNPYAFKHAMEFEISKVKEKLTDEIYEKVREKVAKKMAKNPEAYRDTQLANAKDIQKKDKKLAMVDVKDNNTVDKDNEMKKVKGFEAKKNTSTPKSENKKGKPKGVKEMKGSKKKPSGVQTMMESTEKQDLVSQLTSFFKKKINISENTVVPHERTDYHIGTEIKTPEGQGKVTEVNGSVIHYELEGGIEGQKTLNVIDKLNGMNQSPEDMKRAEKEKDKAERDKMWADWDKRGEKSFGGMLTDPEHFKKPLDYKNLMEKIKAVLDKLKTKKEAVDIIKARNAQGGEEVIDTVPAGQGNKAVQDLKKKVSQKGGSISSLKSTTVK